MSNRKRRARRQNVHETKEFVKWGVNFSRGERRLFRDPVAYLIFGAMAAAAVIWVIYENYLQ